MINLLLQLRLFFRNSILRRVILGGGKLIPARIIRRGQIGQVLDALLNASAHGRPGGKRRLLLEKTHRVARLKVHPTFNVGIDPRENPHQRRFAGTVKTEHADFSAVIKGERDVAEDFLALDFFRDAEHREDNFGGFRSGHRKKSWALIAKSREQERIS